VLGGSDLAPCKAGQERNPDTNRCRNVVSMPTAEYTPEQTTKGPNNYVLWWSLGGVGLVTIGYGIWEWRQELVKLFKKIISLLHRTK
jgi:hypothetical protein